MTLGPISGGGGSGGGGGGMGDVIGPASSTDNAITRWDGTTGKLLQDSVVILDDKGNILDPQVASTSGSPTLLQLNGAAHTTLTASTEASDVAFNLNRTVQFSTGPLTQQRAVNIGRPTYDFVGPSTLSSAVTQYIQGVPDGGPNASISGAIGQAVDFSTTSADSAFSIASGWPGISNGTGNVNTRAALIIPPAATNISLGDQTASLGTLAGLMILSPTFESTTNVRTVNGAISLFIGGPPIAGPNVVFSTTAYSFYVGSGPSRFSGRVLFNKGADVASANDLTLGNDGNFFSITGTTQINGIATADWTAGSQITLQFNANLTVKHNTAAGAGFASLFLAGAVDFSATADDLLQFIFDGTVWRETARTTV